MSVRSAQAITASFVTSNPTTHAAADADSLPTGTLVVSGTDNGATVTVTHIDTGRYKAAVTLPSLAIGDVVEIVVSATVATVAEKFVAWRDTADVALSAAGDVTLADGVAHGGTPGSSTATLAMQAVNITNPSGTAATIQSTGSNGQGLHIQGSGFGEGMFVSADPSGIAIGFSVQGGGSGGSAAKFYGFAGAGVEMYGDRQSGTHGNPGLWLEGTADMPGLLIQVQDNSDTGTASAAAIVLDPDHAYDVATNNTGEALLAISSHHGVKVATSGSGHRALILSGDAATDALAIAAGAGSPIDIFDARGYVTANEAASIADAVQASPSPTTTAFAGSSSLNSTNSFYVGSVVVFTSGSLAGLARKVTNYTGSTRLITVTSAWPVSPTAADTFRILGRID